GLLEADLTDPRGRRHRLRFREITSTCRNSESSCRILALDAPRPVPRAPFPKCRGLCHRLAIPRACRGSGASTLPFEPVPELRKLDAKHPAKAALRCRPLLHC